MIFFMSKVSELKNFEVKGSFTLRGKVNSFTLNVKALNESKAKESAFARIGGNYQCKRRFIKVDGVKLVK